MRVNPMRFSGMAAILLVFFLSFTATLTLAAQSDSQGPETLVLKGGTKGDITLPHREHQHNLKDCKICHTLFPKKAGSIAAMKGDGQLKKKQVMNKLCLNCHRKMKRAGKDTGPTSCSECHRK